jgi:hypothetical protein
MATLTLARSADDDTEATGATASSDAAEAIEASVVLLDRARRLREGAANLHPLVASAYRRRAAELAVAAWVGAIRSGVDEPPSDAA